MKVGLFPGSFDPFHNGHLEIVERASHLFDEVVVAALRNPQKSSALFDLDERKEMLEEVTAHIPAVRIVSVSTLLVNVARDVGASAIVRGLRAVSDFETEMQMAQMNHHLSGVETIFIPTSSKYSFVASKLVREVARFGGDVSAFVPKVVAAHWRQKFEKRTRKAEPMTDQFLEIEEPTQDVDAESVIGQVLEIINTAKSMPLSSSVIVSREEVVGLLQAALDRLPDELRQARWLLREREEFLAERTREAETLMEEVRAQAERMVQRTEIVRQANSVAQRILDDANDEARTMRHEAEDFCDQKLAGMEIVLDRLTRTVQSGRAKLAARAGSGRRPRATAGRRDGGGRLLRPGRVLMAADADPFVVHVARLRRNAGRRVRTRCAGATSTRPGRSTEPGIDPGRSVVPLGAEAECDVTLRAFSGGIAAVGHGPGTRGSGSAAAVPSPVSGELVIARDASASPPMRRSTEDELYPIADDTIDLGPLVRDAIVLELPMAPLCREDCRGLCPQCGADRNEGDCGCVAPPDPRWANLDVLR